MRIPRAALLVLAVFSLIRPAQAWLIFSYNGTIENRFSSGSVSSNPVINSSFFLNGYDLSGIGNAGGFGLTLISSQYAVTATHVTPANGTIAYFTNTAGVVKSYTVASSTVIQHPTGVNSDLVLVKLSAPIPTTDLVNPFSTLLLNSVSAYIGLPIVGFGASQTAGVNEIDNAGQIDFSFAGGGTGTLDDYVTVYDYDSVSGQTQGEGGDSGSPTFVAFNGQLLLIGTHSAVSTSSNPTLTLDVLTPAYYTQINQILAGDGQSWGAIVITPVPEPATIAALMAAAALGVSAVRRRRTRK